MLIKYSWSSGDYGMSDNMVAFNDQGECVASEEVYPLCECPEDATIERDLIGCKDIIKYMRIAYEAGKNGEEFIVNITEEDEEE